MRRRLMLNKTSGGGSNTLYVFKDGAYGDWLNGEVFHDGGLQYNPNNIRSISADITGGMLVLNSSINRNRRGGRSVGILLPSSLVPKKINISIENGQIANQWGAVYRFGVAQTFVTATDDTSAFTAFEEESMTIPDNTNTYTGTIEKTVEGGGYRYLYLYVRGGSSSVSTFNVPIKEIWIEI